MVYSQMPSFYRAPLTVDTSSHAQKFFEEEDSSILDDNILDQSGLDSGLEMSPAMADSRRDSFAVSTTLFSPKAEDWQSVEMQSVPSNNPFLDQHSNNPFMRLEHQQPSSYSQPTHSWSMSSSSGSATPMQTFDGLPSVDFESSAAIFQQRPTTLQGQTPFNPSNTTVAMFQQLSNGSIPASPQKDHWMSQGLKEQAMAAKRNRPPSPLIRSHNELRRGDGIRKKNARFDIPAERNLSNIDNLIAQSQDEQEIKELKQQKRLLRNRQAALDSRQRKKQHTERLEDEKKQYTELIGQMESDIDDLRAQMDQLVLEKQQYGEYIERLNMEKEELIRNHTIETGELRKKVNVLTNHVQTLESSAMATATPQVPNHSSGYHGSFGEMDGLTMDGSWDSMPLFGEYHMEQQPAPVVEVKQEMQIVPIKKQQHDIVSLPTDIEKPAQQGGLLFMLFLVGAFVLSSRSTPSIPRVSEDVRLASADLLDSVLKDHGVAQSSAGLLHQASSTSWGQAPAPSMAINSQSGGGMDGVAPSMLGDLADSLTQPTEEQTNEQLFSLSSAQYNSVSSHDFLQSNNGPQPPASQGRRNLAEALANIRNSNKQHSTAEVYTRSLLWDSIPSDVVRNFAKMVAECSSAESGGNSDRSS